ncbi:ARM repeat superfamily protein [Striga hermonthica]|uniref:ARM repeat superfamily protein n=1 Tax=Striga hermonthica TaxID=68872 RepID=A0A9N7RH14_STRHE|nr:ARM repeat superfamily protein [Striga hermonthica]
MSGVHKTETTPIMFRMLKPWMETFSSILLDPVPSEDRDDWSMRKKVLKCLNQFIQIFPTITEIHFAKSEFAVYLLPLWETFISTLEVYECSAIEGVEYYDDDPYASSFDGVEDSLESLVNQLFELLVTATGSPRFVKVIMNKFNLYGLVYYTIGFLQMTDKQVESWLQDANKYVAEEDNNTYSCRVSGALLLEDLISNCGTEGIKAVIESVITRRNESQQAKDTGSRGWWKLREAALYALAALASEKLLLDDIEVSGSTVGDMLRKILIEDMAAGFHDYPFLCARLFLSVARFSFMMNNQVRDDFVRAAVETVAVKTVGMDVPPLVKFGACRALSQLLPDATTGCVQQDLLLSLIDLLKNASDGTMHLVLATLQAAVAAGHEATASIEPNLSSIMLNMWDSHVCDPFISIDALKVLEAIIKVTGCTRSLFFIVFPYIEPILNSPQIERDGLVAGSLDLVTMLIKNAPVEVVKALFQVSFDPVVIIVLQSTDYRKMKNATQCLATLVSVWKQDMLSWSGEIQGAYQIKVTTTALALLLLTRHVELGNINVKGHLIKSDTGITTRSKAKKLPDQWTVVPLPTKILAILADTLLEIQEQVDGDNEEDSDSNCEEVESEDNDFLSSSAKSALHVRPTYEYLDAMAKAFNEDQEDDFEDELFSGGDPLNEINLANILFESLQKFLEGDKPCFEHLFQSLTKPQQEAIELVLRRWAV